MKKILLLLVFLLSNLPTNASAKAYSIRFERPYKVGQMFLLDVAVESRTERTYGKRRERPNLEQVSYRAKVRILAVDKDAQPIKTEHTILEFFRIRYGRRKPLLPKGTKIVATLNKKGTQSEFYIGKKKVSSFLVDRMMSMIVDLRIPGTQLKNALFGSKAKRKVGQSWSANKKLLLQQLHKSPWLRLNPKSLRTRSTLVKVSRHNGLSCLEINTDLVDQKPVKVFPLDKDFKARKRLWKWTMRGTYPVDKKHHWQRSFSEMIGLFEGVWTQDGKPGPFKIVQKYAVTKSRKALR